MRINQTAVKGMKNYKTDAVTDLAAFDLLPKKLRNLLNYAPVNIACPPYLTHTLAESISDYQRVINRQFPNWKPFTKDPIS